jgi:flavin-dependent dehydrogenase
MASVDVLIVGAGPAGLRAAQILAAGGREVLVLEKKTEVGNKTCGGGLSLHAVRELEAIGLPATAGRSLIARISFAGEDPIPLEPPHAVVRTLARRELGRFQLALANAAGAEVRFTAPVSSVDLAGRTVGVNGGVLRYRHLIGADGSASVVRRALGLPSPRALVAAEYNIAGLRQDALLVLADSAHLASGYFWIFPHTDYASIGAVAPKDLVRPDSLQPYLDRRLADLGIDAGATPLEALAIEVEYAGLDFPNGVHLTGDAAGLPSGLTAEGIYPALISGEETAGRILEPGRPRPKTRAWLRGKVIHDTLARLCRHRKPRDLVLRLFGAATGRRGPRRLLSRLLATG